MQTNMWFILFKTEFCRRMDQHFMTLQQILSGKDHDSSKCPEFQSPEAALFFNVSHNNSCNSISGCTVNIIRNIVNIIFNIVNIIPNIDDKYRFKLS